jgi:hypothetical protein
LGRHLLLKPLDGSTQRGQFMLQDVTDHGVIGVEVVVNQEVAHPNHGAPVDIGGRIE